MNETIKTKGGYSTDGGDDETSSFALVHGTECNNLYHGCRQGTR